VVSLLIGVNNQYQNLEFDVYAKDLIVLLDSCRSFVRGDEKQIIVFSIPDYGFTPFGKANQPIVSVDLDRYNYFADSLCTESGISYYNITDISREAGYSRELIAPDSLHPSALQYKQWIDRHYNELVKKFK
jgi:acyl-CoA thioesterase-1